jgi:hypothetical protein
MTSMWVNLTTPYTECVTAVSGIHVCRFHFLSFITYSRSGRDYKGVVEVRDWILFCGLFNDGRSGKLLLTLASTVILGSESDGTHDHILFSHDYSGNRTWRRVIGWLMNWKGSGGNGRSLIEVLSRSFPGKTEKNREEPQENWCSGRDSNRAPPECKSR